MPPINQRTGDAWAAGNSAVTGGFNGSALIHARYFAEDIRLTYAATYGMSIGDCDHWVVDKIVETRVALPSIKREKKLPVVPSREEAKRLMKAPTLVKHRELIGLLYGCGQRCFELRNLKLPDLDFDRKMLQVCPERNILLNL